MANEPVYDDAEVEEILRRALDQSTGDDGLSHAELEEVAAEVGLSPEELGQAARSVLASRAERREREEAQRVLAQRKRRDRRGFAQHVMTWGVVGAGLAALDYLSGSPGITWAFYPIVGWGIGVGLHGVGLMFRDDEKELRKIARQIRRQREREARAAARKAKKKAPMTAEAALEAALDKGIALLLHKVAEKLESAATPTPKRDTDFNRFAAKQRGEPVRVEPSPSAPRARVDGSSAEPEVVEVPRERARGERER